MSDNILVDTSAWIISFRETGNQKLKDYLKDALDLDRVMTTNLVVLELLQGCKTRKEFDALKSMLDNLPFAALGESAWIMAYETGFSLRRKGLTIPTVDILICSVAKANGLKVLHHDAHLKSLAREMGIPALDFLKSRDE